MSLLQHSSLCVAAAGLAVLAGCSGGSAGSSTNRGTFKVNLISTGRGQVYPYRIRRLDGDGNPTDTIISIESKDDLTRNAKPGNPVLPVATFPTAAELPNGAPGNHFLLIRFAHHLQPESILSDDLAAVTTSSGLTTAISLVAYDPATESTTTLRGRGFVGGKTFVNVAGQLELIEAVTTDGTDVTIEHPVANGFPIGFSGATDLVHESAFVFVADTDSNLSTFETFPAAANAVLQIQVSNAVRNSENKVLEQEVCTATSVGQDPSPADVVGWSGGLLQISPGNGSTGVDPLTSLLITFNKPVQPFEVGTYFSKTNLTPAPGAVSISTTQGAATYTFPYYADPVDFSDLCSYRIIPSYALLGDTDYKVAINRTAAHGLNGPTLGHDVSTDFRTGDGTGLINAPVAPDVVYVGIGGSKPGVAVIDLNGFGQGTNGLRPDANGNPTITPNDTNWPNNPNFSSANIYPPLSVGTSQMDAGSMGMFSLAEDTKGNAVLLGAPLISQISDIHIGAPLDLVYNNLNINVNVAGSNHLNAPWSVVMAGNCISANPHPNPPKLDFLVRPNPSRGIFGEEPTDLRSGNNQLVPSNEPTYRQRFYTGVFVGPAAPPPSPPPPPVYSPYYIRQQIGHFLYVLDRENRQILVVNSNRFIVLDTIRVTDPIRLSMSPNLGVLAVSNFSSSSVTFINTDPSSPKFHEVIAETKVAPGPTELAWQPDGEAIAVVGTAQNQLTVISASDFSVSKIASGNLVEPIGIVATPRYQNTGNLSGVWYAYVLNRDGSVAVFESGPDGVNGIGFNEMIGTVAPTFRRPTSIRFAYTAGNGGFYVSHVDEAGVSQVSLCELTATPLGQLRTNQISGGFVLPPTFRQKGWTVTGKWGGSNPGVPLSQRFSGNSIADIAFDEMLNQGAMFNQVTPYNGAVGTSIIQHSSKGAYMLTPTGALVPPISPVYMFVALRDTSKIDVIELSSNLKVHTIEVPGVVQLLSTYWRQ